MALLRIANLKKSYNITKTQKQDVLKGVDVEFKSGDLVALLGESGCGKSTLINILGGLDNNYTGSVVIKNSFIRDFTEAQMDDYRKKRVGLIFQNYNLIGHATLLENIELAMTISNIDEKIRKERALDLLKMVGLGHYPNKYPSQLSGGQKQRVAIARALANNPTIILADEPTGALDKDSADIVMKILKKIAQSGKLVIIVTHSEKVANECGRVIKMDDGRIVSDTVINKFHIDKGRDKEITPKNIKRKDILFLSYKNIKRNKSRSVLMSIGMAVGIAAMLIILCLSSGLTNYINNVYSETYSALDLEVYQSNYNSLDDDDYDLIMSLDGVDSLIKTSFISDAEFEYNDYSDSTSIYPLYDDFAPTLEYGTLPENINEIAIDLSFASSISTDSIIGVVGTDITIEYEGIIKTFMITGITSTNDTNKAYIITDDMEDFVTGNDAEDTLFYVKISDITYISAVVSDLNDLDYNVVQQENGTEDVLEYIDLGTSVLTGVGSISMVVSAIMIFIVLYISVSERIKEIGILRSVGARKKDIKKLFIYEAGMLGLLGGLIGVAACIVLSTMVNIICLTTLSYALISYNIGYYLIGILFSTIISILAGFAPSMRAAELDPVDCLRAD